MANTKDKVTTPSVYGGAYDQQINDLYSQLSNREPFQYNVNEDALYQQYKDRYTQNARRSMKDTMGQAASLTGGYGSTYSQGAGQQAYDETMRGLTDKIPELEERAFGRYQQQGEDILNQYNIANQLGAADQATRQYNQEWQLQQDQWALQQQQYEDEKQQYADKQVQLAYENLSAAILQSGYQPTAEELAASGMTQQQADALRQAWIAAYPGLAYMQGVLSAEDYYKLTGQQAPGAATGGGGGGYYGKPKKSKTNKEIKAYQKHLKDLGFDVDVNGKADKKTEKASAKYQANNQRQTDSLKAAGYSDKVIDQIMNSWY